MMTMIIMIYTGMIMVMRRRIRRKRRTIVTAITQLIHTVLITTF